MATVSGAIVVSHTPTVGFALDNRKQSDLSWSPIVDAVEPSQCWLHEQEPDALVVIDSDHISSSFLCDCSPFALCVGERYEPADEGGRARDIPAIAGHSEFARHMPRSIAAEELDLSVFQDRPLAHGSFSTLSRHYANQPDWPMETVPLQVGMLQLPAPIAQRCYKSGSALHRAVEGLPDDLRVAIVCTGGAVAPSAWRARRLQQRRLECEAPRTDRGDPERLARVIQAELATLGGTEGAEVVM